MSCWVACGEVVTSTDSVSSTLTRRAGTCQRFSVALMRSTSPGRSDRPLTLTLT